MSELIRQIEPADVPVIGELLKKVFPDGRYAGLERLGGMTNHSYKVTREDCREYLVRIPGEGTEELIDRRDERKSTALACGLGIDTELLYFGDDGTKIMAFISDPQPMDAGVMARPENLAQAAAIFRKLHTCGQDTGVRFEVFEMADGYESIIRKNHVALYGDYEAVRETVMAIKREVDGPGQAERVPCHNDSLMGNWVLDPAGRLYLIDWEYAGMNEAMWDLSCLSIEADYTEELDMALLTAYYGRTPEREERKRFLAAKLYVDLLWTLWGLTRVPYDGAFMQEYADVRYDRLKGNIAAYQRLA